MAEADEPTCLACGYDLTDLTSKACPECGWQIDWEVARAGEEQRRIGTPAHRARGWRRIDRTAWTVLVMLFAPWRFARQVRVDEAIWPSLIVAALSCLSWTIFAFPEVIELIPYAMGAGAVIVCQSVCFASLYRRSSPRSPRWPGRFRLWLIVSLYSTCFVAAWPVAGGPPFVAGLTQTNFYWPFSKGAGFLGSPGLGVTIIFYWWWAILTVVLVIRNRPRWLGILGVPLVFLFSWIGALVVAWAYNWF